MTASVDSRWLVAALAQEVRDFVICAGSRSAPLAYAVADAEAAGIIHAHPFFDERAAGFYALGLAASTRRPVAVITTSGTAPAHLLPAVIEAFHTHTPLIVISADRPFEMQDVGASQTTRQTDLFGSHITSFLDIPAGLGISKNARSIHEDVPAKTLVNKVRRLLATTLGRRDIGNAQVPTAQTITPGGPAHINIAFRDPLVPQDGDPSVADLIVTKHPQPTAANASDRLTGHVVTGDKVAAVAKADSKAGDNVGEAAKPASEAGENTVPAWEDVVKPLRTVIVAGDKAGPIASTLATAAGIPLLAEPSSGAFGLPGWAPHQQQMLTHYADEIEQVIVLGHPSLSRPVSRLLADPNIRVIVCSTDRDYTDVSGNADLVLTAIAPAKTPMPVQDWTKQWHQRSAQITRGLTKLALPDGARAAHAIWDHYAQNPNHALVLGASNPIRYVDLVASAPINGQQSAPINGRQSAFVHAARGQAGIDGTIATAKGIATRLDMPVRVLLGDLTFLHDLNSLVNPAAQGAPNIDVVVIDDKGGRIFKSLEHGLADADMYERFFALGQNMDYQALAAATGWQYVNVDYATEHAQADLEAALASPPSGRIIHIRANHEEIRDEIRSLFSGSVQEP
ncbi:MAG: 2-succinyl-5-enolpyruvyl-6-hydroxy-3-cyclohexene-1-carboxylic-acid synthase [Actinomycetaceae bacterium]|nr:2-succinyl-5-enolpyruvyl-6-hydroxy-3-cyclohexene-1-carboxylic-acid synthase [Actinomycetaceae bacterium]